MALLMRSSVARSVGIVPALRRASGPRASPSPASPRPLAYHSRQAGYYSNGGAPQKQRSETMDEIIMAMKREEKIYRRFLLGFFALSGGFAIYSGFAIAQEIKAILREEAAAREEARVKGTWV